MQDQRVGCWSCLQDILKHAMATHVLDAGADRAFVKDGLGHANIQNTTLSARLTTATLDAQAQMICARHRTAEKMPVTPTFSCGIEFA
jgi:site-specific recombinase XerC